MAPNQNKKRKAMSISDMVNGGMDNYDREPKHRSSYSGPKRSQRASSDSVRPNKRSIDDYDKSARANSTYVNTIDGFSNKNRGGNSQGARSHSSARTILGGYIAPSRAGGIMDYAWIVFVAVLGLCLMTSLIAYGKGGKKSGIYYPRNVITVNGVLNIIYDEYWAGGLGSKYAAEGAGTGLTGSGSSAGSSSAGGVNIGDSLSDGNSSTGTPNAVMPNSTTGATMALDTGEDYEGYTAATSHEQVVAQLDTALSSGDVQMVGRKLAYEDETTGALIGYPQSVVEHFTSYMSANPDKRELFISEIKADGYTVKNGNAFIVKLPLLKFTVNMGYDNTTLSISGFSDQMLNSGQSATVQPLLPCMYTITVATTGGSQSSEVEANMNEGNLQINIGVAN